jgi:hypothetical protein
MLGILHEVQGRLRMSYCPYIPVHLVHRTVYAYRLDVLLVFHPVNIRVERFYDFLVDVSHFLGTLLFGCTYNSIA